MTVWMATASARPVAEAKECFDSWKAIGCKTAATRKECDGDQIGLDLTICLPEYRGMYRHDNLLAKAIMVADPNFTIMVTGGDDIMADPNFPAAQLEAEFIEHFGGTLGVMQPTGLAWDTEVIDGRETQERIAWGPWIGREWCERAYMGKGAYWDEPWHFFGDELLQITAERFGLFWQRRDIMQEHRQARGPATPDFRVRANRWWDTDKALFERVRHPDWPGAQLLPR